ncbi:MAG: anthranilate synthase component I, partial [Deltaproteobacteria bacterium]|nr:anthranilate synthase component I [Deltaproteobacteria bacterium]
MSLLSFKDFHRLSQKGDLIPLVLEIPADLDTPVSAFLKLSQGSSERFLLESMEGGERWGRYSFMGTQPEAIFSCLGSQITWKEKTKIQKHQGDPLEFLRAKLQSYH